MEAPTRTTSTRNAASAILIVLALGLAFRLILAHVLPGSGFRVDLIAFRFWADNLAKEGLFGFYQRPFFHDYTPGYMYFLALVGHLEGFLRGVTGLIAGVPLLGWFVDIPPLSLVGTADRATDLIKLPAIVADLALGWLAWSMTRELGAGRRAALVAGAIVVFNPITWFDSVVWGQVDSIGMVFLLLGVRELWRDRPERSAVFTVIAAIIKPQLGILIPVVAAVVIRRALFPSGGHGNDAAPGEPGAPDQGRTTTPWERRTRGPIRILTTGLAGVITAVVVSAPFGLSIVDLAFQVATAAAGYPYLTVNAYNPWALLELNGSGLAASGGWVCDVVVKLSEGRGDCTEAFMFGPLPALAVGTALLLAVIAVVTVTIARRPDRLTILVGVAVLALAFFVVPTRVHERYLFPLFAIAAILAAVSWRWRVAYVLLAVATFANMYVVLTTIYSDNPRIADWLGIGEAIRSSAGVTIVALVHLLGLLWVAYQLREPMMGRLRAEIANSALAAARRRPRDMAHAVRRASPARPEAATAPVALAATSEAGPTYELPEWRERQSFVEAGPLGWLRSRLNDRPVRPDRTAALAREGGGRLDRLDLWIVVVLVLAALTLRVWRLAEPYRMHFDEVYHARTATEFLQFWRYGLQHEPFIYEWTHPHLAKYAIAGGIVQWGNDRVRTTSELGVPVRAAAIEERWLDSLDPDRRAGERLHVATGSEVRSYDLRTRRLVAAVPVDGAAAIAVDQVDHILFVGTDAGELLTLDLHELDAVRDDADAEPYTPVATSLARLDGGVTQLHATGDGSGLLAGVGTNEVVMLDPFDGRELGRAALDAVAGFADAGTVSAVVAHPGEVVDVAAAAAALAEIISGDPSALQARLEQESDRVVLAKVDATGEARTKLDEAIADGRLAGLSIESVARVAIAHGDGVALVLPDTGEIVQPFSLAGGAQGIALVSVDDPRLYVTTADPGGPAYAIITVGGSSATDAAVMNQTYPLPAAGSWVGFDEASDQVHVLGEPPAGRPSDEVATVYVIEPHANAVYADAALPFAPAALVMDANESFLASDREELLALGPGGTTAAVDVGAHAFAWRLPGVLAGVAMAALLYLLTRILFRRRAVAVLVACLTVLDGMLFVQSRIAMNDAYVGLFIIAAYTVFAALWTGAWRWRGAFWVGMPAIGLLLGLALASKWVAAYAIGALGVLVLARSALGRVVLLGGLIVITTALGYLAISVPLNTPPEAGWQIALLGFDFVLQGNLTFMLIMVALTLTAAVVIVLHPIAWSIDELRFAIGAPAVAGGAIALLALATGRMDRVYSLGPVEATPLELAFGLAVLSLAVAGAFWLAGRAGFGPLAPPPGPDDPVRLLEPPAPPAEGWLRPGWALGLPVGWMIVSLIAIPVGVYVASYVPWALFDMNQLVPGWPAGHTGQTLLDLTGGMYGYHNTLTDPHAASSPWWAWPFDLKPVWFYQESFAGGTSAAIYDAGNLAIWWMGVPAMAFCAWQAFKRRSLALALVTVGFACQWIPWARIDRAAFQYHYYTGLPFVIMGLAYFIAELWHGASRRTWLMARLAAAAAIIGPAALWLFHRPLCAYVRVDAVNPNSQACPTFIPEFVLTWRTLALAIVVGLTVFFLVRRFLALDRPDPDAPPGRSATALLPIAVGAGVALVALLLVARLVPEAPAISGNAISVEPIALIVGLPLLALAAVVATARDARRFVVGMVASFVAVFVIFYPNISALPLPAAVFNAYQGLLPTYLYPFQFPVSIVDRTVSPPRLFAEGPAILLVALTVTSVIVAYSAWIWRLALAERQLEEGADEADRAALAGSGT